MEKKKYGVLMVDVSKSREEVENDTNEALQKIIEAYPEMEHHIFTVPARLELKHERIAELIRVFDYTDILFCNTCGDEIDHLYRFVRAIAKNAGLEIIPVHDIKVGPDEQKEDTN